MSEPEHAGPKAGAEMMRIAGIVREYGWIPENVRGNVRSRARRHLFAEVVTLLLSDHRVPHDPCDDGVLVVIIIGVLIVLGAIVYWGVDSILVPFLTTPGSHVLKQIIPSTKFVAALAAEV